MNTTLVMDLIMTVVGALMDLKLSPTEIVDIAVKMLKVAAGFKGRPMSDEDAQKIVSAIMTLFNTFKP